LSKFTHYKTAFIALTTQLEAIKQTVRELTFGKKQEQVAPDFTFFFPTLSDWEVKNSVPEGRRRFYFDL